jgi:hypothetical protein
LIKKDLECAAKIAELEKHLRESVDRQLKSSGKEEYEMQIAALSKEHAA